MLRITASRGFSEVTQKCSQVVLWSLHPTPSLKISCKSVQPFSRNLADKETKKQRGIQTNKLTKKEIDRKQYPVPDSIGGGPSGVGVINYGTHTDRGVSRHHWETWTCDVRLCQDRSWEVDMCTQHVDRVTSLSDTDTAVSDTGRLGFVFHQDS